MQLFQTSTKVFSCVIQKLLNLLTSYLLESQNCTWEYSQKISNFLLTSWGQHHHHDMTREQIEGMVIKQPAMYWNKHTSFQEIWSVHTRTHPSTDTHTPHTLTLLSKQSVTGVKSSWIQSSRYLLCTSIPEQDSRRKEKRGHLPSPLHFVYP